MSSRSDFVLPALLNIKIRDVDLCIPHGQTASSLDSAKLTLLPGSSMRLIRETGLGLPGRCSR